MIGEKDLGIRLRASQFIGAKLDLNYVDPCPLGWFPVTSQGSEVHVANIVAFWNRIERD